MKLFKFLICVLCFIVLAGCGQMTKNIPAITGAGSSAYVGFDVVVEIISAHLYRYSDLEIAALETANKELVLAKLKIERLAAGKNSLAELAMNLPELMPLYNSMKGSYMVAYTIVASRMDMYSPSEQLVLLDYNETCSRLDQAIIRAMLSQDGSNNEQIVRDILNFAGLVAKIVIPLLML
jgi:hypothetical protein